MQTTTENTLVVHGDLYRFKEGEAPLAKTVFNAEEIFSKAFAKRYTVGSWPARGLNAEEFERLCDWLDFGEFREPYDHDTWTEVFGEDGLRELERAQAFYDKAWTKFLEAQHGIR